MEAASATEGLDHEALRAAELGFLQYLRRKRISERFLATYAEDLFGQAQKEYATWLAAGNVAENAVGWLINCAWRRTQDLLDELRRRPPAVSVEDAAYLADTATPGPEEQAIDHDIHELLQHAMSFLPMQERKLLELTYFEGFDVFAAGRELGWGKSSAHRHHRAALERLRALLPEDRDALGAEIGLAAWVAVAGDRGHDWSLPGGIEAVLHSARDAAGSVMHRVGELWRRVSPAADPSNASATSGVARAAGACGVAAVACLASGVIGPGVGAIDLGAHQHHQTPKAAAAPSRPASITAPIATPSTPAAAEPEHNTPNPQQHHTAQAKGSASTSSPSLHSHGHHRPADPAGVRAGKQLRHPDHHLTDLLLRLKRLGVLGRFERALGL